MKIKNPKHLSRHYSKLYIQMANMHEKMLNNISHQEYASQNYSEIPCHICQYGYNQKDSG